jgi:hypothetical protein
MEDTRQKAKGKRQKEKVYSVPGVRLMIYEDEKEELYNIQKVHNNYIFGILCILFVRI